MTKEESLAIIRSVHIEAKTGTRFFNPEDFKANNHQFTEYDFKTRRYMIGEHIIDRQTFKVERTDISFKGNFFYHNPLLKIG